MLLVLVLGIDLGIDLVVVGCRVLGSWVLCLTVAFRAFSVIAVSFLSSLGGEDPLRKHTLNVGGVK